MSSSRISIFSWSIYILATAAALLLVPDNFTDLFGLDATDEIWIRVAGVIAGVLGIFYLGAAIHRARWMYWYSVPARIGSGVALAILAVTEGVWQLWGFATMDILGAGWTFVALRWKPPPEPLEPSADG